MGLADKLKSIQTKSKPTSSGGLASKLNAMKNKVSKPIEEKEPITVSNYVPDRAPVRKPDYLSGLTEARSFPVSTAPTQTTAPLLQGVGGRGAPNERSRYSPELAQAKSAERFTQGKERLAQEKAKETEFQKLLAESKKTSMALPQRTKKTPFGEKPIARTFEEMQSGGFVLPQPNDPEYKSYINSYKTYTADKQAFGAGFSSKLTPVKPPKLIGEAIETAQEFRPKQVKAGEIAGELTKQVGLYTGANSLMALAGKTGIGGKIGSAVTSKLGSFGAEQTGQLAVDILAQAPREFKEFVNNDKPFTKDAETWLKNRGIDVLINAGISGVGMLAKSYKSGSQATRNAIEEQVATLPDAQKQTIQQELGLSTETTAQDFLKQQEGLARDIQTEDYLKQFDKTPQQLTDDFNAWRQQNFGGSFGKVSPADEQALKELYKESTGIDLDVAIKEAEIEPLIKQQPQQVEPLLNRNISEDVGLRPEAATLTPRVEPLLGRNVADTITEPIDTTTRVLVESPKKIKGTLGDKYDRLVQETVSKNIPFERIGGRPEIQASNLNRVQGTIEHNIVSNQIDMLGSETGKSLVDIFSDLPKEDKKGLFDYAFNKHNIDRFAEGKPVFGDTVDDVVSASKVADYEANNPIFKEKQQEITNYFDNLMNKWSVKSGLVSEDTAKILKDKYPNYVPTYRAKDLPRSISVGNQNVAQMIKNAKGSENFILPLDQQMIALTERTITNARRNELMNTIANAFEQDPSSTLGYIKEIKKMPGEAIDDVLDVGRNFDAEPVKKGNEYLVNFYTDGQPRQMVVNKTLYKALETAQSDHVAQQVANYVKKYATNPFKELITGKNPIFAASNIMRDVPTALTYSADPLKMSAKVPDAVKEILTNGEKYKLFKAMGGSREGLIGAGKEFKVPTLSTPGIKDAISKVNPIKTIGDVNNFTETLPRFSEFLSVLEKTGDPAMAIFKSAELTTDFARHGNLTKFLDNFVPYLNPSVQGISKFTRSFKDAPLKTIAKGASVITIPTVILDQVNKDNKAYNDLPARERNLYFNVPIPNSDKFLRIPKSRELGVAFSSLAEWSARAARGEKVTGDEIISTIKENFTPADITSPIWTPALKAWNQIKDPEAYETNYWGGLIVPESMRKYSPGEQYDMNSSGIAKAIGEKLGISPYVTDYFLKSYGGIISQVAQPIGRDKKQSLLAPLESKFINDPTFKNKSIGEFYDLLDEKKKATQDYNKQNNIDSKVVTPLERQANTLSKVSKKLSSIRKEQRALQTSDDDKAKENIKKLQKAMNAIAEKAVRGLK